MNHRSKQIFDGFVGRFRHSKWLHARGFGPDVFLFRNLESGQVMYTQLPFTQVCIACFISMQSFDILPLLLIFKLWFLAFWLICSDIAKASIC